MCVCVCVFTVFAPGAVLPKFGEVGVPAFAAVMEVGCLALRVMVAHGKAGLPASSE